MYLTTAINRDYPYPTSEKNEVGMAVLDYGGEEPQALRLAAFLSSGVSVMDGRTGGAARLAGRRAGTATPVSVVHPMAVGCAKLNRTRSTS